MAKQSAGILLFRNINESIEVLIGHPGGPYWSKKDTGAWSIPKGEFEPGEDPLAAAKREFEEETGKPVPSGVIVSLGSVKQSSGKIVHAWAVESDFDVTKIKSNLITIQWPPRSGKQMKIPEIDRAGWFALEEAAAKLVRGQVPFVVELARHLSIHINIPDKNAQSSLF